jgi:thioredoxin reductase (NADPH)
MEEKNFDLIIVGGGPTGINCAIEAQKSGLKYLVLEKGVLINSIYNFPTNMTFFSTSKNLEIGDVPFISHTEKPTRSEALEYYRRIYEHWDLKMKFNERVLELNPLNSGYQIKTSKNTYKAKFVIIATGYFDNACMLNVPGEKLGKVKHYYDAAHPYIGQKVLVVGGANSACDVALETWQKGADVTMVVRDSTLYQKVKYWILPNIENRIKEGSIKAYFNSHIIEIFSDRVRINTPEGTVELENDYVLAMTGYKPDYSMLKNFGIQFGDDDAQLPKIHENTFESNLKNVFLAGVILGGLNTSTYFIENTRHQGAQIISSILERAKN